MSKLINSRKADSLAVERLRDKADAIAALPFAHLNLTKAQKQEIITAADAYLNWTNTYIKPNCKIDNIAVRHFTHLIMIGEYYECAHAPELARPIFRLADALIPESSPLRAKAEPYASELVTEMERLGMKSSPSSASTGDYSTKYRIKIIQSIMSRKNTVDLESKAENEMSETEILNQRIQEASDAQWNNTPETMRHILDRMYGPPPSPRVPFHNAKDSPL